MYIYIHTYIYFTLLNVYRVDGLLFVNLTQAERGELGIRNAFHMRKLELIIKAFQTRYGKKKNQILNRKDDDDDDGSEYTPSGVYTVHNALYTICCINYEYLMCMYIYIYMYVIAYTYECVYVYIIHTYMHT